MCVQCVVNLCLGCFFDTCLPFLMPSIYYIDKGASDNKVKNLKPVVFHGGEVDPNFFSSMAMCFSHEKKILPSDDPMQVLCQAKCPSISWLVPVRMPVSRVWQCLHNIYINRGREKCKQDCCKVCLLNVLGSNGKGTQLGWGWHTMAHNGT